MQPFITHLNFANGETPIYPKSVFHPTSPPIGILSPQSLLVGICLSSFASVH